jgi:NAD(P)H-flavin reductase
MLYGFGVGEVPISISGDPGIPERLVHTLRAVGPVTNALAALAPGDMLGVRGPYGTHWPMESAVGKDVVVVAGGIGLAPLRPVLFELSRRRERYGRITVLYGARTPEEILFEAQLQAWGGSHDFHVRISVDRGTPGWRGSVGVVTTLIPAARFEPRETVAMVCGPEVMARFTILELRKRGVPVRNIHVSMERNMKCAVGFCGHCQFGSKFVCKDGPVFGYDEIRHVFNRAGV